MVVKTRAILERLQALDGYIRLLQPYRERDIRRLTDEGILYGGILHYLQLAAQAVMDVSTHLQVELEWERVADYKEAILSLGKHGLEDLKVFIVYITDFMRREGYLEE